MGRNSGGTYSLPGANFTPGSTIRSEEVNNKFTDIAQALTDSLDRSGAGGMLGPFKAQDGSNANPSITFLAEQGLGFSRPATSTVRLIGAAATIQEWALTYVNINRPLTVAPPAGTIATALSATGVLTGGGGSFTGGTTNTAQPGGFGVTAKGGTGGPGGSGGVGLIAQGGAGGGGQGLGISADGGIAGSAAPLNAANTVRPDRYYFRMGNIPTPSGAMYPLSALAWTNANGANEVALDSYARTTATVTGWEQMRFGLRYDVDNVAGAGGMFELGTTGASIARGSAATATSPVAALTLTNAHIAFADTVVSPSATTAVKNTLTPANITKAWAVVGVLGTSVGSGLTPDVATSGPLYDLFNIDTVTATQAGVVTVTFKQAFASAAYKVSVTVEKINDLLGTALAPKIITRSASSFQFRLTETNSGGTTTNYQFTNTSDRIGFHIDCMGRQ